jgi:hypothetical protein
MHLPVIGWRIREMISRVIFELPELLVESTHVRRFLVNSLSSALRGIENLHFNSLPQCLGSRIRSLVGGLSKPITAVLDWAISA